jgi:hypothetical protein
MDQECDYCVANDVIIDYTVNSPFGNTRNNTASDIKSKALDKCKSLEDRTRLIHILQKIPHKSSVEMCMECIFDILKDETIPIEERYFFFSNNIPSLEFSSVIVDKCHNWFFFDYSIPTIKLKINSARYIASRFPVENYDVKKLKTFLLNVCNDETVSSSCKKECSDILYQFYNVCLPKIFDGEKFDLFDAFDLKFIIEREKFRENIFNYYEKCKSNLAREQQYNMKEYKDDIISMYSPKNEMLNESKWSIKDKQSYFDKYENEYFEMC